MGKQQVNGCKQIINRGNVHGKVRQFFCPSQVTCIVPSVIIEWYICTKMPRSKQLVPKILCWYICVMPMNNTTSSVRIMTKMIQIVWRAGGSVIAFFGQPYILLQSIAATDQRQLPEIHCHAKVSSIKRNWLHREQIFCQTVPILTDTRRAVAMEKQRKVKESICDRGTARI